MNDRNRRLWVFQEWELEQQQAWLTDMAQRGWHLKSTRPGLVSFQKGEPARIRYRCEVAAGENPEQIELYQTAGWEYVGQRNSVLIFRAPEDERIAEIHTDSSEQALTLRLLVRNRWLTMLGPLVFFPAVTLGFLYSPRFVKKQLLGSNWLDVLSLLFIGYIFFLSVKGLVHLGRLNRQLKSGKVLRSAPYQKLMRRRQLFVPLMLLLAVLLIAGNFLTRLDGTQANSFPPVPAVELPMVRLSQLLDDAGYTDYEPSGVGAFLAERAGGDVFNYYREQGNLLFPVQQELSEMFEVAGVPDPANPERPYRPTLVTRRYSAATPALARLLATQLAAGEERELFRMTDLQPKELSGADGFWRRDAGTAYAFVMVKDSIVLDVFYNGVEPVDRLIELELNLLEQFLERGR